MNKKIIFVILALVFLTSCKNDRIENKEKIKKSVEEEHFCYLSNVYNSKGEVYASVDFIDYMEIAKLDSSLNLGQIIELPNGYCYVNKTKKVEDVRITKDAKILMQTASYNAEGNFNFNEEFSVNKMIEYFANSENERIKFLPFKIRTSDKIVISINEIYIP